MLLLPPSAARAYERTLSDHGVPLRWAAARVPLPGTPPELGPRAARAVEAAFRAWTAPGCTGLRVDPSPGPSGPVRLRVVRQGWPHGEQAAAYTTVDSDADTGAIRSVLIELNGAFAFDGPDALDLEALLTHEAGHALGLAHSYSRQAVMYLARRPGQLRRRPLADDDVKAVCAVYPAATPGSGAAVSPSQAPVPGGLSPVPGGPSPVSASQTPVSAWLVAVSVALVALAALVAVGWRRGAGAEARPNQR